jgi:hypothetical protein
MNTKNDRSHKSKRHEVRLKQKPKRQGRRPSLHQEDQGFHEHERIETRMFR